MIGAQDAASEPRCWCGLQHCCVAHGKAMSTRRAERATRWSPLRTERTNTDMRGSIKLRGPHSIDERNKCRRALEPVEPFSRSRRGWTRCVFLKNAGRISAAQRSVPALLCAASGVVRLRAADRHRFISLPTPAFPPVPHYSPTTPGLPRAPWHARSFSASPARHNPGPNASSTQPSRPTRCAPSVKCTRLPSPSSIFPSLPGLDPASIRKYHPQASHALEHLRDRRIDVVEQTTQGIRGKSVAVFIVVIRSFLLSLTTGYLSFLLHSPDAPRGSFSLLAVSSPFDPRTSVSWFRHLVSLLRRAPSTFRSPAMFALTPLAWGAGHAAQDVQPAEEHAASAGALAGADVRQVPQVALALPATARGARQARRQHGRKGARQAKAVDQRVPRHRWSRPQAAAEAHRRRSHHRKQLAGRPLVAAKGRTTSGACRSCTAAMTLTPSPASDRKTGTTQLGASAAPPGSPRASSSSRSVSTSRCPRVFTFTLRAACSVLLICFAPFFLAFSPPSLPLTTRTCARNDTAARTSCPTHPVPVRSACTSTRGPLVQSSGSQTVRRDAHPGASTRLEHGDAASGCGAPHHGDCARQLLRARGGAQGRHAARHRHARKGAVGTLWPTRKRGDGAGVGVLSSDNRDTWTKTREHLLSVSPVNRKSINSVEDSLLWPFARLERACAFGGPSCAGARVYARVGGLRWRATAAGAGRGGHNRWHQRAGRAELAQRECGVEQARVGGGRVDAKVDPAIGGGGAAGGQGVGHPHALVRRVRCGLDQKGGQAQSGCVSADGACSWRTPRRTGQQVSTYETASTRLFKHGRTDVIRSFSDEAYEFVRACARGKDAKTLYALLTAATKSHKHADARELDGQGHRPPHDGPASASCAPRTARRPPCSPTRSSPSRSRWRLSTSGLSGRRPLRRYRLRHRLSHRVGMASTTSRVPSCSSLASSPNTTPPPTLHAALVEALRDMRRICEHGAHRPRLLRRPSSRRRRHPIRLNVPIIAIAIRCFFWRAIVCLA
ncbi:hypothetical protein L1887_59662 [Cichorium endivia]|nr:hypothetical protein L1887_59662 [Cichorium endivia]